MKTNIDPKTQPDIQQPSAILNYDDADQTLLKIADAEQYLQKAEAEMNEQIQKIRDEYERTTFATRAQQELLIAGLEKYCISNKIDFEKTRSKELVHGIVGFRNAPPKVSLLNRKYKFDTVIELLKKVRWGKDFIRQKEDLNKEQVLASYSAKEIDDSTLAKVGLKIDQNENFFHEIRWDSIPSGK